MNFLIDTNLPPALARALNALTEKEGHSVAHLTEKFSRDTPDIDWINALKSEGNWVILSQDNFRKGDLEKKAIRECGLVVFCLAKQWSKAKYWDKAHNLVRWWPAIMDQADMVSGGAAFKVPWRLAGKGRFEQVKI